MKVSTSILSSEDRIHCVEMLNHTHTSYIHVDVMDGKFVDDKQFNNIGEIKAINTMSKYPLDVHLMVNNPLEYIEQLSDMNIAFVTFHLEVGKNIKKIIKTIHTMGYKVGLAIKPKTDVGKIEKYLDEIDMILVMSVEPGKGGQKFINNTVERISDVKKLIGDRDILVEVDGGINDKTIDKVNNVDIVVSGSYIVKSNSYYKKIESLVSVDDGKMKEESTGKGKKSFGNFLDSLFVLLFIYFVLLIIFSVFSMFFGIGKLAFFGGSSGDVVYGIDALKNAIGYGLIMPVVILIGLFPLSLLILFLLVFFVKFIISKSGFAIERSFLYIIVVILYLLIHIIYGNF